MPSNNLAARIAARNDARKGNTRQTLTERIAEREALKAIPKPAVTGNTETDDTDEVRYIKDRLKRDRQAMENAYDMAFYLPLVFVNRAQADAFLKAMGWESCMDATQTYLDGVAAAKIQKVALPDTRLRAKQNKPDAKMNAVVPLLD